MNRTWVMFMNILYLFILIPVFYTTEDGRQDGTRKRDEMRYILGKSKRNTNFAVGAVIIIITVIIVIVSY